MNGVASASRPTVWHDDETAIQQSIGVAGRMTALGPRVIRDYMPDQHRAFYGQIPFIVAGSVDAQGDAWATLLEGAPGFISSPTPTRLVIDAAADPSDPAGAGIAPGRPLGLLGLELHTRRRNRLNGVLAPAAGSKLRLDVEQSFGNCPKYIQLRDVAFARDPATPFSGEAQVSQNLDEAARGMIARADTLFVASYSDREGRRQVDVSHRGGKAGFVRIDEDGTLRANPLLG